MSTTSTFNGERRPVMIQERTSCGVGDACFTYPSRMSVEDLADLKEWMALILRKLERWTLNDPLPICAISPFANEPVEEK